MLRYLTPAALAAAVLVAATTAHGAPTAHAIDVRLELQRFGVSNGALVARGRLVAAYRANGVVSTVAARSTTMTVRRGRTCSTLRIDVADAAVPLRGLVVGLAATQRRITLDLAAPRGSALARLFCRAPARAGAFNAALRGRVVVEATVPVLHHLRAAETLRECRVLNTVLGPIALDLAGLTVHMNAVELDVTATRTDYLGTFFCELGRTAAGP